MLLLTPCFGDSTRFFQGFRVEGGEYYPTVSSPGSSYSYTFWIVCWRGIAKEYEMYRKKLKDVMDVRIVNRSWITGIGLGLALYQKFENFVLRVANFLDSALEYFVFLTLLGFNFPKGWLNLRVATEASFPEDCMRHWTNRILSKQEAKNEQYFRKEKASVRHLLFYNRCGGVVCKKNSVLIMSRHISEACFSFWGFIDRLKKIEDKKISLFCVFNITQIFTYRYLKQVESYL